MSGYPRPELRSKTAEDDNVGAHPLAGYFFFFFFKFVTVGSLLINARLLLLDAS